MEIILVDMTGSRTGLPISNRLHSGINKINFDVTGIKSGMYLLMYNVDGQISFEKVMIK